MSFLADSGCFCVMYKGKNISVDFNFDRLKTELELCAPYGARLAIAGKSVTIVGECGGVHDGIKDFSAEEVYLTGGLEKQRPLVSLSSCSALRPLLKI